MDFETCAITDKGGRKSNEDSVNYFYTAGLGCWVVADGLGGHAAGEVASDIAANAIAARYKRLSGLSVENIRECFRHAQDELLKKQEEPKFKGMRTTAVALFTDCSHLTWAHIGDSRLYFFRKGKLVFQTKDHSVSQACVQAGEITTEQIRFHEDRNRLLKVLGSDGSFKVEIHEPLLVPEQGDAFLLCTDGFWEYVLEREMEQDLLQSDSTGAWMSRMVKRLLSGVIGENDNYSAIAVFVK